MGEKKIKRGSKLNKKGTEAVRECWPASSFANYALQ